MRWFTCAAVAALLVIGGSAVPASASTQYFGSYAYLADNTVIGNAGLFNYDGLHTDGAVLTAWTGGRVVAYLQSLGRGKDWRPANDYEK